MHSFERSRSAGSMTDRAGRCGANRHGYPGRYTVDDQIEVQLGAGAVFVRVHGLDRDPHDIAIRIARRDRDAHGPRAHDDVPPPRFMTGHVQPILVPTRILAAVSRASPPPKLDASDFDLVATPIVRLEVERDIGKLLRRPLVAISS